MYIAHSPLNTSDEPHYLEKHTEDVKEIAVSFSGEFDHFGISEVSALMHDLGKKTDSFQKYIQSEKKVRGSVKHAAGGAIAIREVNDSDIIIHLISLIVLGHHSGLTNFNQLISKLNNAPKELQDIGVLAGQEKEQAVEILRKYEKSIMMLENIKDIHMYISILTRFCFSSLVDADWLDTERYFNKNKAERRRYGDPNLKVFLSSLNHYMENELNKKEENVSSKIRLSNMNLSILREYVFHATSQAASQNEHFFTLHAPTGSGKTLASLSFALHHALSSEATRPIKRIIFALPLTNLTEQTSSIYRKILGSEHVIEDHSLIYLDDFSEETNRKKLAIENWDRSFIVTTTVQLFESLFSNRPSAVRKLHRIANSIVIFDEYQKLPLHVLKPILFMLKTLREHFGVTVLLMSATPIALEQSKELSGVGKPIEILPDYEKLFSSSQRVEYREMAQALEPAELISSMKDYRSVLCIVNTRKDAQKLFRILQQQNHRWEKIFHISATMCSAHRLQVIQEIKASRNKSIAVISTSLIEAGADLDFDAVFRMYAPLDSIIQSAGRCNREGHLDKGIVYLFNLKDAASPSPFYQQSTLTTKQFLVEAGIAALENPKECISYFRKIYSNAGETGLDIHQLNGENLLQFQKVANVFKLIEEDYRESVICVGYKGFPIEELEQTTITRQWFRKMQQYTINLDKKTVELNHLEKINGIYIWRGEYDPFIGYSL